MTHRDAIEAIIRTFDYNSLPYRLDIEVVDELLPVDYSIRVVATARTHQAIRGIVTKASVTLDPYILDGPISNVAETLHRLIESLLHALHREMADRFFRRLPRNVLDEHLQVAEGDKINSEYRAMRRGEAAIPFVGMAPPPERKLSRASIDAAKAESKQATDALDEVIGEISK